MCASGHVTGNFAGGSCEGLKRARQTQCFSRITHLAKLNPNCHMNYSIIFTEISFSPETSISDHTCGMYVSFQCLCCFRCTDSRQKSVLALCSGFVP